MKRDALGHEDLAWPLRSPSASYRILQKESLAATKMSTKDSLSPRIYNFHSSTLLTLLLNQGLEQLNTAMGVFLVQNAWSQK